MADVAAWIVSSARVAAFASGPDGRVLCLNQAAEELFVTPSRDACGSPCHRLVAGRDPYGNEYCGCGCPVLRMAWRGEPVRRFRLDLGHPSEVPRPQWVSVFRLGSEPGQGPSLVHLFEAAVRIPDPAVGWAPEVEPDPRLQMLTPEEATALELSTGRVSISAVASALGVSYGRALSILLTCFRKLEILSPPEDPRLSERLSSKVCASAR